MIFITGGAGSIGSSVTREFINMGEKVTVFDSSEYGLFKLKQEFGDKIKCTLGSLKDRGVILNKIFMECDVIHLASIKNIVITEDSPRELIYSNIVGTLNLIDAARQAGVRRFLTVSSDKSVEYTTMYGASKFLQEKMTLWANNRDYDGKYSVIRMVNVKETNGNVFETWKKQHDRGEPLTLTDPYMKRHILTLKEATKFIISAWMEMKGGEIFVPKSQEYYMVELAKEISNNIKIIGIRHGEKVEEKIMTDMERTKGIEKNGMVVIK